MQFNIPSIFLVQQTMDCPNNAKVGSGWRGGNYFGVSRTQMMFFKFKYMTTKIVIIK